jgi:hypothetical protein
MGDRDFEARIEINNSTDICNIRNKISDNSRHRLGCGGFKIVDLSSGNYEIDLDFRNRGSGTARIRKARLSIMRVA